MICDFVDYAESCTKHLNSRTVNGEPHYARVTEEFIIDTKEEIKKVLQEAVKSELNLADDYNAMDPSEKSVGKFYYINQCIQLSEPVLLAHCTLHIHLQINTLQYIYSIHSTSPLQSSSRPPCQS